MMVRLRGAFSENPRLVPLLDGTVKPTGIEIDWERGTAGTMFLAVEYRPLAQGAVIS